MPVEGLIGLGVGLVGVAAAILVMIGISAGWFSALATVRPAPGTPVASREQVLAAILALDDPRHPWTVHPATDERRADAVGEWRFADQRWWGILSRSGLRANYRVWFALDGEKHELTSAEEETTVSWGAQGPSLSLEGRAFKGMILFQRTREIVYGLKDEAPFEFGKVVDYDFDPWRVKGPVVRAALDRGWTYRPQVFRRQLRRAA